VHVSLIKRIPAQAGLGGGSSDAAAALRALDELWRTRLDPDALHDIAAALGADVPYFLTGGSALGVGRGDRVFALPDWPSVWLALVQPSFGVSTREAYAWLDRDRRIDRHPRRAIRNGWATLGWALPPGEAGNDFERPVGRRHPAIVRLLRGLARCGAVHAAMSGSGAAVFGVFRSRAAAASAALAMAAPQQPAIVTRTIGRREYADRARPLRQGRRAV
jgi:4-diphosphocytidyl-2-C-methyl-D-erythritol kinase